MEDVPLQGAVLTDRLVRKAVNLADAEDAPVQRAEHRPAAFGAEIEREEPGRHNLTVLRPFTRPSRVPWEPSPTGGSSPISAPRR